MSILNYLRKRGLTLEVLDYQHLLFTNPNKKRDGNKSQKVSRVYNQWLSEQPKEVTDNLPKHWSI